MDESGSRTEWDERHPLIRRWLDEVAALKKRLRRLEAENERLRQRLAQYEPDVLKEKPPAAEEAAAESSPPPQKYSVEAEEKRRGK